MLREVLGRSSKVRRDTQEILSVEPQTPLGLLLQLPDGGAVVSWPVLGRVSLLQASCALSAPTSNEE